MPFSSLSSFSRGKWAGYGLPITWTEYGRSQFGVILHYLRLSFWPHPLVLDYGWPVAQTAGEILPGLVVIGGLVAATVYGVDPSADVGFCWGVVLLDSGADVQRYAAGRSGL